MSETVRQLPEEPAPESVVERYRILQKAGGIVVPILTVVLAFFVGGIVILLTTGSVADTLETYKEIFEGSGLSWFFDVGNNSIGLPFTDAHVWFPWNTDEVASEAAANLQQTLILWVPARSHRPRRRLCVPVRPLQHRRPGPVPRRLDRRRARSPPSCRRRSSCRASS